MEAVSFEINAEVLYMSILAILAIIIFYLKLKPKPVYLLDFACCKPPSSNRVPMSSYVEHTRLIYDPKAAQFQMRILERAGLGDETCLPLAMHYIPFQPTLNLSRDEVHLVVFSAIDELLAKTKLVPSDIDVLVTNCSIFCPAPSLSTMIVNKYKMRSNVKSFNLSGMGCGASPVSIDLASKILEESANSYALVVSTEIITPNSYVGTERSMLVPGCLFRLGCAAILLTNKQADRSRAKYRLLHIVRTHKGSENRAYKGVTQAEDANGTIGIALSKDLITIAAEALRTNISSLGPLILPVSEMIRFGYNFMTRKILGTKKIKPYVPNFNRVFDHFCIHAGGRAVIDELQTGLRLSDLQVEASRMALHRFGNTSSSTIWYGLSYPEAKGRMKKGDLVWQIAFGSGFKCNSAVWKCNRDIKVKNDGYGPWRDCIDKYPVHVPEIYNW